MEIVVEEEDRAHSARAASLAAALGAPRVAPGWEDARGPDENRVAVLLVGPQGLSLRGPGARGAPVRPDIDLLRRARRGRDDLLRAVLPGVAERLRIADATAGLGADAFVIAASGARVVLCERSPVLHALLVDALERARDDPDAAEAAARITLRHGDAQRVLPTLGMVDVVYLDPMYPDLGKSAAKNKEMRLFRGLVGDDPDAADLLKVARGVATQRVVVKRPSRAPPLQGRPSGSIRGRTVRFDLYPPGADSDGR